MIQNWLEKFVMMKMHYITNRLKTVNWCDKHYLYLNIIETKEMCIDFRKRQRCPRPVCIREEAVEGRTILVLQCGFESKLNWKENINFVLKVNSRIYSMRKLRSFGVNSYVSNFFFNAVICSIVRF